MNGWVTVYPKGMATVVPADRCRCPILDVGDACPVHQQIPLNAPRPTQPMYLDPEECLVLLQALVVAVEPLVKFDVLPLPADPTECSRMVWDSETATPMQRSLATALAEATYR